jgi:hypothetical protein
MKKILIVIFIITTNAAFGQLIVNNQDLNKTVKNFELHLAIKPFTSKQCLYIDYGQDGFRESNYDLNEKQSIYDSTGNKFVKGDYMKLYNYLTAIGWEKDSQRESSLGDVKISIILFKRKD